MMPKPSETLNQRPMLLQELLAPLPGLPSPRSYPSTSGVRCPSIWLSPVAPSRLAAGQIGGSAMMAPTSAAHRASTMTASRALEEREASRGTHTLAGIRTGHAQRLLRPSAWIPGVAAAAPPPQRSMSSALEQRVVPGQQQQLAQHRAGRVATGRRTAAGGKAGADSPDRDQVARLIAYHAIC